MLIFLSAIVSFSDLFRHECLHSVNDEPDHSRGEGEGDRVHVHFDLHGREVCRTSHGQHHAAREQDLANEFQRKNLKGHTGFLARSWHRSNKPVSSA